MSELNLSSILDVVQVILGLSPALVSVTEIRVRRRWQDKVSIFSAVGTVTAGVRELSGKNVVTWACAAWDLWSLGYLCWKGFRAPILKKKNLFRWIGSIVGHQTPGSLVSVCFSLFSMCAQHQWCQTQGVELIFGIVSAKAHFILVCQQIILHVAQSLFTMTRPCGVKKQEDKLTIMIQETPALYDIWYFCTSRVCPLEQMYMASCRRPYLGCVLVLFTQTLATWGDTAGAFHSHRYTEVK